MDSNLNNNKVVCCFCGESLFLNEATILTIQSNIKSDEKQQLFCHKNHFVELVHKTIFLHSDFLE